MSGYTALYSSIIHSTVWREPNHVRIVWVTLLAMCDQHGVVESSLPGLADAARVTMDEARDALFRLSAPDEYSRTPDHDGRRIAEVDGGWLVLNRAKYREKCQRDNEAFRHAERQRRYRERDRVTVRDGSVTPSDGTVTVRDGSGVTRDGTVTPRDPSRAEQSRADTKKREEREPRKRGPVKVLRPSDWKPDERCRSIAREWNLDLTLELQSFMAWTDAGAYRYADWNAAFRNHLARARKQQAEADTNRQARFELARHEQVKAEARKDGASPAMAPRGPLPALPRPEAGPAVPPPPGLLQAIRGAVREVDGWTPR